MIANLNVVEQLTRTKLLLRYLLGLLKRYFRENKQLLIKGQQNAFKTHLLLLIWMKRHLVKEETFSFKADMEEQAYNIEDPKINMRSQLAIILLLEKQNKAPRPCTVVIQDQLHTENHDRLNTHHADKIHNLITLKVIINKGDPILQKLKRKIKKI